MTTTPKRPTDAELVTLLRDKATRIYALATNPHWSSERKELIAAHAVRILDAADALEAASEGMKKAPEEITPALLDCLVMPNGEVLCLGKSLGYVRELGKCLRGAGVSEDR
jgi:hypothetical protein